MNTSMLARGAPNTQSFRNRRFICVDEMYLYWYLRMDVEADSIGRLSCSRTSPLRVGQFKTRIKQDHQRHVSVQNTSTA